MRSPARRVIIVDPDSETRAMYRTALHASGFDTDEAADGRDALVKALAACPSAIVLEGRLPFIDGYDLCRILTHDAITAEVPVVFLSGDARPTQMERAWNAGADAVLTKPCRPEALVDEIRRLITQSRDARRASTATRSRMARASFAPGPSHPMKVRAHQRFDTTQPPLLPPSLYCPSCDQPLVYEHSHIGGVSALHTEQWDYFACASCGTFEYRQRTRKLRAVVDLAHADRH
jgi:CheY-like chemotaxis protein